MVAIDIETIDQQFGAFCERVDGLQSTTPGDCRVALEATLAELQLAEEELQVCLEEIKNDRGAPNDRDKDEWRLLNKIFTGLPVPVFLLDIDASIRRANEAGAGIFGTSQNYLSRRPLAGLINLDSRAAFRTEFSKAVRGGAPAVVHVRLAPQYGDKDLAISLKRITQRDETQRVVIAVALEIPQRPDEQALTDAHTKIFNLGKALNSRGVIGQATGFLMARRGLTADKAFEMLIRASQNQNVKLVTLAESLVADPDGDHGI